MEGHKEPNDDLTTRESSARSKVMTKTISILYVPGAWHEASTARPVASLLEEAGYTVDLIDLPSVGPAQHLPNFNADVEEIRSRIEKACDGGQEIVLVGHSYGSIPMCEASKSLDLASRQREGKQGGVKHLFYLAAFVIDEGHSLIGAFGGQPLPWFKISDDNMEVNPDTPEKIFYNDLDPETQESMIGQLKPQSYQVMHTPVRYAAWKVMFLAVFSVLCCIADEILAYPKHVSLHDPRSGHSTSDPADDDRTGCQGA
jgi:hypothetical protein